MSFWTEYEAWTLQPLNLLGLYCGKTFIICGLFRDIAIIGRSVAASESMSDVRWNGMALEGSGCGPVEISSLKFLGWIEEYHKICKCSRCLYRISKHTPPEDSSPITLSPHEPARWKPSGWRVLSSYKGGLIALIKLQLNYAWIVAY